MRIGLAYRRFGLGAAVPLYCLNLATALSRTDEVWAFTREYDAPADSVRVVHLPLRFRSKRLEYGPNTALNSALLRARRRTAGLDVIHTQDGELVGGDVVTAHSLIRVVYRTFRRTDPEYVRWMPKSPLLWCEDIIYGSRRYSRVIATSGKMAAALHETYRVPDGDVAVIPLGVDLDLHRPDARRRGAFRQALGWTETQVVLVHVSTDYERKGLETIVRALGMLPDDFVLAVAGRGHEERFRALAEKLGVGKRVAFLGYRGDLETVYPGGDVFVFPTRLDFFGYPVLEAMACGTPPIVSRDAGVAELLTDGRDGFLLEDSGDERELADHIRTAASALPAAKREARATAERHSVSRMVEATRRVYGESR
jgi:glycosyltransferase involved in cell wall biosynthesis